MSTKLEIERKFLVKFPSSWEALSEMFDDLVDVKRISQTYLNPDKSGISGRVRKTVQGLTGDTETVYHYNHKKSTGDPRAKEETEREISKAEFQKYLKNSNPDKVTLEKTRFVFNYNDQTFELDVFKGPLKGLAILEIELKNKNDKVELPPFLPVKKEVTEDERYTNFYLASKHLNARHY